MEESVLKWKGAEKEGRRGQGGVMMDERRGMVMLEMDSNGCEEGIRDFLTYTNDTSQKGSRNGENRVK